MSAEREVAVQSIAAMTLHASAHSLAFGALQVQLLDADDAFVERATAVLDDEERARAARFVFDVDRRRYIVAHAQLRRLLAKELSIDPRSLRFQAGAHGKPELSPAQNAGGVRFNLSHSRDVALIAWTRGAAIGVDIEVMRSVLAEEGIARRFFSPREQEDWLAVAPAERTRAFFNCWTRKEAFIKAVGRGLSYPLDSFDVSLAPNEPPRIRAVREKAESGRIFGVGAFEPRADAVAAVVIEDVTAPVLRPAP